MSNRPNEVWVDDPAPGGWICGVCLYPVESEPCEQHDGAALTDEQLAWLACICSDPTICWGIPGEMEGCDACYALDVELHCLHCECCTSGATR